MCSVEKGISLSLVQVIQQATAALVCMDAERLEHLARSSRDLACEVPANVDIDHMQAAGRELRLLALTMDETRANLRVLERLHRIRLRECGVDETIERKLSANERQGSFKSRRVVSYGDN